MERARSFAKCLWMLVETQPEVCHCVAPVWFHLSCTKCPCRNQAFPSDAGQNLRKLQPAPAESCGGCRIGAERSKRNPSTAAPPESCRAARESSFATVAFGVKPSVDEQAGGWMQPRPLCHGDCALGIPSLCPSCCSNLTFFDGWLGSPESSIASAALATGDHKSSISARPSAFASTQRLTIRLRMCKLSSNAASCKMSNSIWQACSNQCRGMLCMGTIPPHRFHASAKPELWHQDQVPAALRVRLHERSRVKTVVGGARDGS